CQQESTWPLTF
nr:immunoglobulin light chain junction region [Macaca mulatta]MOW35590.1 immunoglobulin light chain junction region [Macaca mulatta]MOW35802.1 immunoglobulin light chain junction region [Macaca mulatta]MOW35928.1 immunoglobulin light chain junction region [Macaca mulatta]